MNEPARKLEPCQFRRRPEETQHLVDDEPATAPARVPQWRGSCRTSIHARAEQRAAVSGFRETYKERNRYEMRLTPALAPTGNDF